MLDLSQKGSWVEVSCAVRYFAYKQQNIWITGG
jgi:hypothetical protein